MNSKTLLDEVAKRNNRFRVSQIVFAALLFLLVTTGVIIGINTLQKLQKQQDKIVELQHQLSSAVADLKQSNAAGLQKANDHLDCIALFFATPNRINKTLTGCDVNTLATPVAPQASSGVSSKAVTVSPSPSSQPQPARQPSRKNRLSNIINNILRSF